MTRLPGSKFGRALALAAMAAFAAGCGGGGDSPPPPPPQPNITPSGGTVTSADNKAKLIVPPGAAAAPMTVTLTAAPNAPRPSDVGFAPGGFYEIGGNGAMLGADADYEVETETPTAQAARVRRMSDTFAFGCDKDGDGDADADDLLNDGPCIVPPQIAKLSANAALSIGNCVPTVTKLTCKVRDLGPGIWGVLFDNVAPTVTIASVSVTEQDAFGQYVVRTPDPITVTVNATDNKAVDRVEFIRIHLPAPNETPKPTVTLATKTASPYTATFSFTAADNARYGLVMRAFDKNGNSGSKVIRFQVTIDGVKPTVSLSASATNVAVGQSIVLTANAADDVGVTRVEFYRDNVLIGQDTSAPYTQAFGPFTAADVGVPQSFVAYAFDAAGNASSGAQVVVTVSAAPPSDTQPPAVSLTASANTVPVGQSVTLTADATDNVGVAKVEFFRNAAKIGEDGTAPFAFTPPAFTDADIGTHAYTAVASDAAGNSATSNAVTVTVPDTQAPSVSLAASANNAFVGQTVELTATASDNVGVVKVEFHRNGAKVFEKAAPPFVYTTPAYTSADIGTQSYTAAAFDAANNQTTSNPVTVNVSAPAANEVFVNAASGSDSNPGTPAAPFKTLAKAFTTAGGGTVWLQNGAFTPTTEGVSNPFIGRTVPAGTAIKAVSDGGVSIGFTLQFPNGGSISGVNFDVSSAGRVLASGGTLTIERPQWVKLGTSNLDHGIVASGTAQVFLDPKGVATHNYAPVGVSGFATVADSAELTVNGGVIDRNTGAALASAFRVTHGAKLTLANVTIANTALAWASANPAIDVAGFTSAVTLTNSTIDLGNQGGPCILQDAGAGPVATPSITLQGATLKNCNGGGMQLREGTPTVVATNSTIATGALANPAVLGAIVAGQIGFDGSANLYGRPNVTLTGVSISGNGLGVSLNNGGTLAVNGGAIDAGTQIAVNLAGAKPYALTVRNATIKGADALRLAGDGTSSFDLGTLAAPGNNTLTATSTRVRVSVAANVTVSAVGNTWAASVQGADAQGKYTTASSACNGANPCDVTSGTGLNYTFTNAGAGAKLRLAQQ
jgi:biopolymer transport protein ExbD